MPYKDPAARREYQLRWNRANPDKCAAKGRRWREAHPEQNKERSRRWVAEHPEQQRERVKKWRREHPEAAAAIVKRTWEKHPEWAEKRRNDERRREYARAYRAANRELLRQKDRERLQDRLDTARRRRARRAAVPTDKHTRMQVFERDGGICQICRTALDPTNWHEDHIVPFAMGGPDTLENVQATCPPCNLRKGDRVA